MIEFKKFSKRSGRMESCVGKENTMTTAELTEHLILKKRNLSSLRCRCGNQKSIGYAQCIDCSKRQKASWGANNQANQKRKYSPNRKNRKKSRRINEYILSLDNLSKPGEQQYVMKAKTLLRKLNPLHHVADEAEEMQKLILSIDHF